MGICVEKIPHSCGSLNGLQVFQHEDGHYDGYCFACKKFVEHPYGEKEPPPKQPFKPPSQEDLNEITTFPIPDLTALLIS
jgi:twinkle protein